MGLEQSVTFPNGIPLWPAVQQLLEKCQYPVQVRMIDGELAFPDELPSESWRELRLGTPAGMITLQRDRQRIGFVVWGNADAGLLQARNAVMWAFAEAGAGWIETVDGVLNAGDFARVADLPAGFRRADH